MRDPKFSLTMQPKMFEGCDSFADDDDESKNETQTSGSGGDHKLGPTFQLDSVRVNDS